MEQEKYLIDSNSIITPYKQYYQFDFTTAFWKQLGDALSKDVYLLDIVKSELCKGDDELTVFFKNPEEMNIVSTKKTEIFDKYSEVMDYIANSPYYNQNALKNWANAGIADPWLIATASVYGYTIITFEQSAGKININSPSKNAKIPDIAKECNVKCENLFYMMKNLRFKL